MIVSWWNSSSSSLQESPSVPSSKENEKKEKKPSRREKMTSSIEDHAPTVVDDSLRSDSIPSLPDEKGLGTFLILDKAGSSYV